MTAAPRAPGVMDVVVAEGARKANAVFIATTDAAADKELAAMKLDRALGLGLVPATVEREVQGQRGILQARLEMDDRGRGTGESQRGVGWCALPAQFELMYAFDALIGNEGRSQDRLVYDAKEWNLLLTGHDRAFGTKKEFPAHLQQRAPRPGAELRKRLAALDEAGLQTTLGDLSASGRSRRCCSGGMPCSAAAAAATGR